MEISANVVADSISKGVRITTMELCYPRFIHSEFMTHRMFSRNASSSRAIPIEKMLKQVQDSPAMPISWGKNQPGMQAIDNLFGVYLEDAKNEWLWAAHQMGDRAERLGTIGLHKQIVNRLLEPFQWIKVIATATEWDNFFKLRKHADAQPEMALLASKMQETMDNSIPNKLEHGEWHLPYVDFPGPRGKELSLEKAIKCSVARCARVSYLNHDASTPNVEKDIALADKLLEAGHMSPFEHIATPMRYTEGFDIDSLEGGDFWNVKSIAKAGETHIDKQGSLWSNNFRGWIQYRAML